MTRKPEIRHYGIIRNRKKVYYKPELQLKQLEELDGREFEEIIKERKQRITPETHGYYRGGIINSCLTTEMFGGWSEDEVHAFFVKLFLTTVVEKIFPSGRRVEIPQVRSTGDLNQQEMNEFVNRVTEWLSEHEIEILEPEQYNLSKYRRVVK